MNEFNAEEFLTLLESGKLRACSLVNQEWQVNPEVKENILKVFKEGQNTSMNYGGINFIDKHNLPLRQFSTHDKVRIVPGGTGIRRGSFLASNTIVLPPSYINIGAYIDEGTMIDSHVLVGSCAQIGKRVHLSTGVQIGGVLEPIGAKPVVIEDDAFIGADAVIVEGICIGKKAVITPGVILTKSLRVFDCVHEKILEPGAKIPDGAIVVSGTKPLKNKFSHDHGLSVYTPLIIKYRDDKSDLSLILEEALR